MNNKKSIIALLLVAIIGIVGLTIAYFSSEATIENEFQSSDYGTTVEEVFTSPDNWTPGTTTPKTLTVTNTGNVGEAVRISYTETWTSANSNTEGDLALTQNGNTAAIINWANVSDWTTVTENGITYKYYKYQLAPNETTSDLLSSVTFNSAITNDSECETDTSVAGVKTITCNSTGDGYDGATYKLTFHIETVQYDKYNDVWNLNNSVAIAKTLPASKYLIKNETNAINAEYNTTTKGKLFQFTHTLNEGTENETTVTETRYIGDSPKNYVYFNCDAPQEGLEYNYDNACEIWRILGVFDVDDGNGNVEQRIKLVRGDSLPNKMGWNNQSKNDWTTASLKVFLNEDYYNNTGDALTDGYGLKESAQEMIGDAKYYLGGRYVFQSQFGTTEEIYSWERGNTLCEACNGDTSKLSWTGKVALVYPSDEYMVYGKGVNETCYNDPKGCSGPNAQTGWVFNSNIREGQTGPEHTWLLSNMNNAGQGYTVFFVYSNGFLHYISGSAYTYNVRPVVYLKSNVIIADGTGEEGNPYVLELMQ